VCVAKNRVYGKYPQDWQQKRYTSLRHSDSKFFEAPFNSGWPHDEKPTYQAKCLTRVEDIVRVGEFTASPDGLDSSFAFRQAEIDHLDHSWRRYVVRLGLAWA
jgi:hypothetical protein